MSGASIIVQTPEGFKSFTQGEVEKRGVKIMRDGQLAELSDFHKGDNLTAVIITSKPPQILTEKAVAMSTGGGAAGGGAAKPAGGGGAAAGAAAKPGGSGAAGGGAAGGGAAGGGAAAGGAAGGGSSEAAARKLPKTAGPLPLGGVVGFGSLLTAIGLTIRRRRQ